MLGLPITESVKEPVPPETKMIPVAKKFTGYICSKDEYEINSKVEKRGVRVTSAIHALPSYDSGCHYYEVSFESVGLYPYVCVFEEPQNIVVLRDITIEKVKSEFITANFTPTDEHIARALNGESVNEIITEIFLEKTSSVTFSKDFTNYIIKNINRGNLDHIANYIHVLGVENISHSEIVKMVMEKIKEL